MLSELHHHQRGDLKKSVEISKWNIPLKKVGTTFFPSMRFNFARWKYFERNV